MLFELNSCIYLYIDGFFPIIWLNQIISKTLKCFTIEKWNSSSISSPQNIHSMLSLVRQQPFFRAFLSQNVFFSWEGKQKIVFLSCGTEIHFSIKAIHWLLKFSSTIFFFLVGDGINFFSTTMQNLNFFGQLGH